ncbi:MAG TPA: TonB-dependent receptor [Candidatus Acidoferrum sp.]|jgi:outer membrane receptor protein involved in Fe transport
MTYLCSLAVILFLLVPHSAAQTTSTIEGTVKDKQGLAVAGAQIHVTNLELAMDRTVTTESDGSYRISTLPPGVYELKASKDGFQSEVFKNIEVTLNRTLSLDIAMQVGSLNQTVEVDSATPLLETSASSTGATITPQQIEDMPINGRNYLDLLQLVPGVALNRQNDPAGDNSTPILGERGGNTLFLIDGLPNRDSFNGGPSAQFNQDSILEFQVISAGYKAEFGHASGGIVNVLTRGGTNDLHGGVSVFFRNSVFDTNDIPQATGGAPFLNRWDPTAYIGGPIIKDKVFFFGSVERIQESRNLNFVFNPNLPSTLVDFEAPFNKNSLTYDTRARFKLDEVLGRHRITEQMNYTNSHVTDYLPLTASQSLPDTRQNLSGRTLMLGLSDLWTIGDTSNPWISNSYFQFRADPLKTAPSHPQAGIPNTLFNLFDTYTSGDEFGNLGQTSFGPGYNAFTYYQKYISTGSNISKAFGRHIIKFGWDFQNSKVDGAEPNNFFTQLFATVDDFNQFGSINSGINLITLQAGPTPADNLVHIRNNYNGLYAQDDWKLTSKLTVNAGLRWDYDSQFPNKTDFSPRIGAAWAITPKTVVNASFGVFYDQFREGVARDIPGFGGANIQRERLLSFPRLFYGNPTTLTSLFQTLGRPTVCVSNAMTEAQVTAANAKCPNGLGTTLYGIDYLNNVVAPGHAPIPANTVVNMSNIQQLSGFTPDQYLAAADAAIANLAGTNSTLTVPANYWSWDPFGNLTTIGGILGTAGQVPISVDPGFKVPHTFNYHAGIQHELASGMVVTFDYYHKDITDITTVRATNLAFDARMPDTPGDLIPGTGPKRIESYGPWGAGTYDGFTVGFQKRMSQHFTLQANYTFVHANDDVINSTLASEIQNGEGVNFLAIAGLSDSFVGRVPLVTDVNTGQTNANGPFINSILNPVPKAGTYYNGAIIDKGPSDLALNHTFLMHGIWQLPWKVEFSGIFRAQSGFHYSVSPFSGGSDFDGDGLFNGAGLNFDGQGALYARNAQTAPPFVNLDMRLAKRFNIGERVKAQVLFEMFNLLNRDNSAAVNGLEPTCPNNPANISPLGPQACNVFQIQGGQPGIGTTLQYLPGREGQIGIRFEF